MASDPGHAAPTIEELRAENVELEAEYQRIRKMIEDETPPPGKSVHDLTIDTRNLSARIAGNNELIRHLESQENNEEEGSEGAASNGSTSSTSSSDQPASTQRPTTFELTVAVSSMPCSSLVLVTSYNGKMARLRDRFPCPRCAGMFSMGRGQRH